jgi:hypothetical protein
LHKAAAIGEQLAQLRWVGDPGRPRIRGVDPLGAPSTSSAQSIRGASTMKQHGCPRKPAARVNFRPIGGQRFSAKRGHS